MKRLLRGRSTGWVLTVLTVLAVSLGIPAEAATPSSKAAPAAGQADATGDVYAVKQHADGTTSVAVYRPAPGVTAGTLAKKLKATGVQGVQAPAPGDVTTLALPCSYGSARTLECSPVRWAHNGYADPQVYFLDHTSSAWPMTAVVPKWHESVGIDSYYRWYTAGCPGGGRHCVHAYSSNYGNTGWTGVTYYRYNASRYFIDGSVSMQLNDYYGGTAAQRRNTACHEAGHVLGLGHGTSTSSCMYSSRTSTTVPNADDFALLPRIYP
ncbi:matrixin family metalloprotease [Streptomyces sp. TRM70350]|uniref:matrixin family metalloprotease n=1 Tax=Streptomyces sp. TRM70350 TaxID=2856165 RepID=UPI001C446E5B|nr:matrixin family metalloprotease [Streptomyces sp. TRM70350]MBV7700149.1 matrixin family metalloprotease [Streptomyces sp. TRM70350]